MRAVQAAVSTFAFAAAAAAAAAVAVAACDTPDTEVVLDDDYAADAAMPLVVYEASWQAVSFPSPVAPGASSGPQPTLAASDNTAYVVLAPGWNPSGSAPPATFVVLQSRAGYGVHLNQTLHIPVDDATFAGDCAAGDPLTQAQADFITQLVFPCTFAALHYDAATCTTTAVPDAAACPDGG